MQANSPLITLSPSSPSFNSYSSNKLAQIAARVVQEFSNEHHHKSQDDDLDLDSNIFSWHPQDHFFEDDDQVIINKKHMQPAEEDLQEEEEEEEEEFEFATVGREPVESPISADDIFYNGQIRPIYPLFNTSLLEEDTDKQLPNSTTITSAAAPDAAPIKKIRSPLGKLFSEERESTMTTTTTSCSSSEADDLETVPPETYCVWTPKKAGKLDESNVDMCKKSSSTGSSKRWKFRDLLFRSNSDGKDTFVFLTPPATAAPKKSSERRANVVVENSKEAGKGCHHHHHHRVVDEHYVNKNKGVKEGDKRRSFLPYRQDLVGFFSNVNGLSRNLHPF